MKNDALERLFAKMVLAKFRGLAKSAIFRQLAKDFTHKRKEWSDDD
jgi:hypothetical protein